MGSLAYGHHSPSCDLEWYVGRTGLSAHTHLQGAGGDKNTQGPHSQGPQAGSHTAMLGKGEESPAPRRPSSLPAAWQRLLSNPSLDVLQELPAQPCHQHRAIPVGTPLCLTAHSPFPGQQVGWDGPGHRSRARPAASDARSMAVSPMGPEWPPETSLFPLPHVPIPWLSHPWEGLERVSLHWSLQVDP